MNWIIDCCMKCGGRGGQQSGCWNLEFECAPVNEANYWEGPICLTSVAQGTDAKLKIGC